jgi:hypothetical protein
MLNHDFNVFQDGWKAFGEQPMATYPGVKVIKLFFFFHTQAQNEESLTIKNLRA